jgi:hypothetical protein
MVGDYSRAVRERGEKEEKSPEKTLCRDQGLNPLMIMSQAFYPLGHSATPQINYKMAFKRYS